VGVFVRDRPRGPAAERRMLTFISPPVGPYTQALEDREAGDPEGAMRSSAVWFCANKIAYSMAMMRPQTYRGPGPGDQAGVAAVKTPVPPVLSKPSASKGMFGWTYGEWISLQLRGNAWGLILDRDRLGYPAQIELQHPDTVRVRTLQGGQREIRVNNQVVDPAEVWHSAIHVMPGSDLGMSTIKYAAKMTRTAQAAEAFGLSYFEDGAHPSAILTNKNVNKINQPQAQRVKDTFMAATHGTREPVVMGGGWDYQQIQINPADSQFLQLMDAKGADICRYFGMLPVMGGYGTPGGSLTYQNVEQSTLDFLTYPMTPWIIQHEEALTDLVPRGQYVKLDTSPLLRTDVLSRFTAYHMMIGSRMVTQDEARAMEDMPPLTDAQRAEVDALVMPLPPPVAPVRQGE
jgi:HK97 family phage portal protein